MEKTTRDIDVLAEDGCLSTEDSDVSEATAESVEWEFLRISEINESTELRKCSDTIVKLNVGGHRFRSTLDTLLRFPTSRIANIVSNRDAQLPLDSQGCYFIDRDGTHFSVILNFLRSPRPIFEASFSSPTAFQQVKLEASYYGLAYIMFPFTPTVPTTCLMSTGFKCTVTQTHQGIWQVDGHSLVHCRACDTATLAGAARAMFGQQSYLTKFSAGVVKREISPKQPAPATGACPVCC
jgi:hypothetical protein